jgi:crossover junction endodeoxyribonuclease RusA
MIKLILPYPVSANRYWRTFMPKGFKAPVTTLSQEAKDYKRQVEWICKKSGILKPIPGRWHVRIELYPSRPQDWAKRAKIDPNGWQYSTQCIDLDNARKVLNDSLKGVVLEDDSRKVIVEDSGRIMIPDEHPARVVVKIWPIEEEIIQPELFQEEKVA